MKYLKIGLVAVLILAVNNLILFKYFQTPNTSYLQNNYQNIIDSSVMISGDMKKGQALGTGIWYQGGYIITADHVVNGLHNIEVSRHDVNYFLKCKVYAEDPILDVAIIKVDDSDMENIKQFTPVYLKWADSDSQNVGEPLFVIGNPLGVPDTVTSGILSAKNRIFQTVNVFEKYIQTDAVLDQGNSGGAIINSNGEVVGMSDFIIQDAGQGLHFGIESDDVMNSVQNLMDKKITPHAYVGMALQMMNGKTYILVDPTGPAANIIQPFSELVSVNGKTFNSILDWYNYQQTLTIGEKVSVVTKDKTFIVTTVPATSVASQEEQQH
jgi:S1-C subfamily serine protease